MTVTTFKIKNRGYRKLTTLTTEILMIIYKITH